MEYILNPFNYFQDPFLRDLEPDDRTFITNRLTQWGRNNQKFAETVDNWFSNFDSLDDKRLALKVFKNLNYFNPEAFERRLKQLYKFIARHLTDTNTDKSNIILVTPDGGGDSADRHAYDIIKSWQLLKEQVYSISELSEISLQDPVFILFNDTHGTGNQFLRTIWPDLQKYRDHKIFLLAIAISEKALDAFRQAGVHLPFYIPTDNAWKKFSGSECQRLQSLGEKVYSKHPMGYGDAALLTAYYFQCPNNTLPIIWADGNNNKVNGSSYPWEPLFSYKPKIKSSVEINQSNLSSSTQSYSQKDNQLNLSTTIIEEKEEKEEKEFSYRYRVGLLDLNLGLPNLFEVASKLNQCQNYFLFTTPSQPDLKEANDSLISIDGRQYMNVYEIGSIFYSQFDDLAVDVVGCFTRYPLALGGRYNYFSSPGKADRRFMFVSTNQLKNFTKEANCSFEHGLVHILVSQLVVYFSQLGYHQETRSCPMDFCKKRRDQIVGLENRKFCNSCENSIKNKHFLQALNLLLQCFG